MNISIQPARRLHAKTQNANVNNFNTFQLMVHMILNVYANIHLNNMTETANSV